MKPPSVETAEPNPLEESDPKPLRDDKANAEAGPAGSGAVHVYRGSVKGSNDSGSKWENKPPGNWKLLIFCMFFIALFLGDIFFCENYTDAHLEQLIRALESQIFGECDPKLARMKGHIFGCGFLDLFLRWFFTTMATHYSFLIWGICLTFCNQLN